MAFLNYMKYFGWIKTYFLKIKLFFKEVLKEMRQVKWLSKRELFEYTLIVLAITFITAAFLGILDYIFSQIIRTLIFKF